MEHGNIWPTNSRDEFSSRQTREIRRKLFFSVESSQPVCRQKKTRIFLLYQLAPRYIQISLLPSLFGILFPWKKSCNENSRRRRRRGRRERKGKKRKKRQNGKKKKRRKGRLVEEKEERRERKRKAEAKDEERRRRRTKKKKKEDRD